MWTGCRCCPLKRMLFFLLYRHLQFSEPALSSSLQTHSFARRSNCEGVGSFLFVNCLRFIAQVCQFGANMMALSVSQPMIITHMCSIFLFFPEAK